jgi:SAM-dependent methyltransferase
VLTILGEELRRPSPWEVADIGSGTGILTEVLLQAGHRVHAVEPNGPMRAAAEASLAVHPGFISVAATAEATTLEDQSVDLITAAQALHWFDLEATHREFRRILRPGGIVAAIWNTRRTDSAFGAAYEELLTRYGTDYARVGPSHRDTAGLLPAFFKPEPVHRHVIPNSQSLDLEGLRGRLLSSSYIPNRGHDDFEAMMRDLDAIFRAHETDGRICFDYDTEMYIGRFADAGALRASSLH